MSTNPGSFVLVYNNYKLWYKRRLCPPKKTITQVLYNRSTVMTQAYFINLEVSERSRNSSDRKQANAWTNISKIRQTLAIMSQYILHSLSLFFKTMDFHYCLVFTSIVEMNWTKHLLFVQNSIMTSFYGNRRNLLTILQLIVTPYLGGIMSVM